MSALREYRLFFWEEENWKTGLLVIDDGRCKGYRFIWSIKYQTLQFKAESFTLDI